MPRFALALLPALLVVGSALPAQESSDELFLKARKLSSERHRDEARALCRRALQRSPDYHDIRIFMARTYAWDGHYDEARTELRYVLERNPENLDAREALLDVESWSDHPQKGLEICEEGLRILPGQPKLLYRRARFQRNLGQYESALKSSAQALQADPDFHQARLLRDDLIELNQRSKIALDYTYEHFDKTFDAPWHLTALSLGHRFDFGSVTARVSQGWRYGETGTQYEVDAYPKWKPGTYFYLNAGGSSAPIFPKYRCGAEIYHNFPAGIEGSLGFRRLSFDASNVTIYTGSIGKYYRDYLFTLRTYLTPSAIGSSLSGSLAARRYFSDPDTYLTLTLGTGVSPDQSSPSAEILRLKSRKASLGGQTRMGRSWVTSASVGFEDQEIAAGTTRGHFTATLGLEYRF
ncbi:YaiO family outer membrane beta-barrel protein [Holophaga foetida]|uniref:YaiO family outer membrane beta-barrel protein n=1 Tax=Holophaga foetida TaxID=35839 RepID=UPI00024717AF|nr:YaiO family outer membrane beta-barrel protein [Holophaga foetida]